jgi:hypothetical protein
MLFDETNRIEIILNRHSKLKELYLWYVLIVYTFVPL